MKWFSFLAADSRLLLLLTTLGLTLGNLAGHGDVFAQSAPPFAITSTPPFELNETEGGPARATLKQAAEFAWEEFFALSWPAVPQSGMPNQRDTPSSACVLGDQSTNCAGPLVWQTYRSKVEVFPGAGDPPGYSTTAASFGYDALPQYNYNPPVAACSGETRPSQTAWVNLDETDQITLDSMYAGAVVEKPSPNNSAPQLIRFLAKANRTEYEYIAKHNLWADSDIVAEAAKYVRMNKQDPPNGDSYLLLPSNSIEVKAGWRVLGPHEIASGRFHTTVVRYYELSAGIRCYRQAIFGLVALHIIQKTPLAPYFIYATFEQADNILDENGRPAEDLDGSPQSSQPCRADQQKPCPTTPSVSLNDTTTVAPTADHVPPQVVLVPPTASYCTPNIGARPHNRLFYLNTESLKGVPTLGYICVNKRDNDIPPIIVDANKRAHAMIQSYSSQHGVRNSVWQYYKLVNVQYRPINKTHAGVYGTQAGENDSTNQNNPSSYYLANIVVETNRTLQLFSGGLVNQGGSGSNSDYASQFPFPGGVGAAIQPNMFYQGSGYNMGGCMGCHGGQGQIQGGDFSVIVARGRVSKPETPSEPTNGGAAVMFRNRSLQ
ncbi:hypothetical protein JJE66_13865 [Bradyrhizobium diazoefficiens]|uniref:hypothetical protein n=1 Tax=Bradyrhizobium diazoefficiens TaxID=1355477 RepID=UPI001909BBE4|nr:hypothetical protein [Bradyrhizobium diazoefficiens]MBK3662331.1 hypothetical protein [Bradyrhizobium diazoefficiens]